MDKQAEITMFSSTAIALYGYDQGMMSLINTNKNYLATMGIGEEDPLVGIIVSVYYLGCAAGAILTSWFMDKKGRKLGIFTTLATASLGNLIMFISGLGGSKAPLAMMLVGRTVMGLGVGEDLPSLVSKLNADILKQVASTLSSRFTAPNCKKMTRAAWLWLKNSKPTSSASTWRSSST